MPLLSTPPAPRRTEGEMVQTLQRVFGTLHGDAGLLGGVQRRACAPAARMRHRKAACGLAI